MPTVMVNIFSVAVYTLIFLISFANIINPKWIWEKFESHNAKKEPTKEYFIMRRIVGILALIIVSYFILMPQIGFAIQFS